MTHEVARCPYCGTASARLDDAGPDLRMAPPRAAGRGCGHLAFLSVGLEARGPVGRLDQARTRAWLWVRGEGVRAVPAGTVDPLAEYVELIACGIPIEGEPPLVTEYRVGGGTAWDRESSKPGSGEIRLGPRGGATGLLDGHGLYSPAPDALVAEVCRRVGQ